MLIFGLWQRAAGLENPEKSSGALLEIFGDTNLGLYVLEKHGVEKIIPSRQRASPFSFRRRG
jgi:hypothetical protein